MSSYFWYFYERDFLKAGLLSQDDNLLLIDITKSREEFIEWLKKRYCPLKEDAAAFAQIIRELNEYMQVKRKSFTIPAMPQGSPFEQSVWKHTLTIPFGGVVTYGDIARALKKPGASRAVGSALGRNPLPIIIPCHRVIAASGRLGGFGGGIELKKKLLLHEGLQVGSFKM